MAEDQNNKPFERWLMTIAGASASKNPSAKMVTPLGYYGGEVPNNSFSSLKTKNSYVPNPMDIQKIGNYPKGGSLNDTFGDNFIHDNPNIGNIKTDMVSELYDTGGNKAAARFDKSLLGDRSFSFTRNNPLDVVHEVSHAANDLGGVYDKNLDEGLARFAEEAHGIKNPQDITNKFLDSLHDLPENKVVRGVRSVANGIKNVLPKIGTFAGVAALPLQAFSANDLYNKAKKAGADPRIGMMSSMAIMPTTQRLKSGELYNNQTGETYKDWL